MNKKVGKFFNGISLLEVILSITILGILVTVSTPFFVGLMSKNKLDSACVLSAQGVRRAMIKAQSADENDGWGIALQPGKIIIFKGMNFANHDSAYDIVTPVEAGVVFSGDMEIVFEKLTGELTGDKSFVITAGESGGSRTVSVNRKGALSY